MRDIFRTDSNLRHPGVHQFTARMKSIPLSMAGPRGNDRLERRTEAGGIHLHIAVYTLFDARVLHLNRDLLTPMQHSSVYLRAIDIANACSV